MHYNDTGTEEAKNWKDTFNDIYLLHIEEYQKSIDSVMKDSEQEDWPRYPRRARSVTVPLGS